MTMTANGLAKLLEELGELSQVAAKRLTYFRTTEHPDGAGNLNERMEQEIADVHAACTFVMRRFELDFAAVNRRAAEKLHLFQQWHDDPNNGLDSFHAKLEEKSPTVVNPMAAWPWKPLRQIDHSGATK